MLHTGQRWILAATNPMSLIQLYSMREFLVTTPVETPYWKNVQHLISSHNCRFPVSAAYPPKRLQGRVPAVNRTSKDMYDGRVRILWTAPWEHTFAVHCWWKITHEKLPTYLSKSHYSFSFFLATAVKFHNFIKISFLHMLTRNQVC